MAECKITFVIETKIVDPCKVSKLIDVQPTKMHRKGDFINKKIRKYDSNLWVIEKKINECNQLDKPVNDLLDQLPPNLDALNETEEEWEAECSCAIYINEEAPEVYLSSKTIQRLSYLSASFDLDIYCLG